MQLDSIGKYLRKYRREKGLSQETLAEMTNLSSNYIGMLERGQKVPSLETFIELINALGISADMLLCDVVSTGFHVKSTLLTDKLEKLSPTDRSRIFEIIEVFLRTNK